MKLIYDHDHLISRSKTELYDEAGNLRYWGIYDFAFKHRTRIFDENDIETAYVQKDISLDEDVVVFCDTADHVIDKMIAEDGHYLLEKRGLIYTGNEETGEIEGLMKIKKGCLEVNSEVELQTCVMILFSLVEIQRRD